MKERKMYFFLPKLSQIMLRQTGPQTHIPGSLTPIYTPIYTVLVHTHIYTHTHTHIKSTP